jgi:hypothetical protein
MRGRIFLSVVIVLALVVVIIKLLTETSLEDRIKNRIEKGLNTAVKNYHFKIGKVHILVMQAGIEFNNVEIIPDENNEALAGKISSIKITGIEPFNALFHHDYRIFDVRFSGCRLKGSVHPGINKKPIISSFKLGIRKFTFEDVNLRITNDSNARSYLVKNGLIKLYFFTIKPDDTISLKRIGNFSFSADSIQAVTADSIYSIRVSHVDYSALSNALAMQELAIRPNFSRDRFMSRFKYETDRIDVVLNGIFVHDFPAAEFIKNGKITSSFVRISDLNIRVYRDKRKEFRHIRKPIFQDIMYKYHAPLKIDSIAVDKGKIAYSQIVEHGREPGKIFFSKVEAHLYGISNDTAYKKKEGYFRLSGSGLFMGKSRTVAGIKARLYDPANTFTMEGSLGSIDAKDLNMMLERAAFVSARSGKIDDLYFSFRADNAMARGNVKMLYKDLKVTIMDKKTGDSTKLKEKLISLVANNRIYDSNPLPGKDVRLGKIEQARDPERFLFHYCFRSILSGIRNTIMKNPKPQKKKQND